MDLGIHLPNSGALTNQADLVDLAVRAEAAGFESVWVYDHIFRPVEIESLYPRDDGVYANQLDWSYFDALTTLSVVAGATSTIGLGTRVLVPVYRHPVVLSKQLATLSVLSGGRLRLGVGAGWMGEEFDVVDIPLAQRYGRLEEHIRLMRQTWTEGVCEFEGTYYRHPPGGFYPMPPRPIPVILGGFGEGTLRRVAAWADGWAAVPDPAADDPIADMGRRRTRLLQLFEDAGRDPAGLFVVAGAEITDGPDHLARLEEIGVDICDLIPSAETHLDLSAAVELREAWVARR